MKYSYSIVQNSWQIMINNLNIVRLVQFQVDVGASQM